MSETEPAAPTSSGSSYANLDFLRAVAVLSVYFSHLCIVMNLKLPLDFGRFGVVLFFVHTCLVLMMSLERLTEKGEPIFGSFLMRRFFRIYPLSIVCVLAVVIFHLPRAPWWPFTPPSASTLAANIGLYMNLVYAPPLMTVLWSLPLEVEMYFFLPAMFVLGKRFGANGVLLLWLLACVAGATIPKVSGRLEVFAFAPCFLAGVLTYFLGYGTRPTTWPAWIWPLVLAGGGVVFGVGDSFGYGPQGAWAMCLLIGLLAPFCRQMSLHFLRKISEWVARYSFGIYLTHLFAMWVAFGLLKSSGAVIQWSTLAAFSIGLPVLLFHLIEAPFIQLGSRLERLIFTPLARP